MGVLVKEVRELYEAFSLGQQVSLPELSMQYADYAVWQRDWLQGEVLAEQLGYWKQQLAKVPARLNLPTDHPRPSTHSLQSRGASQSITLSNELTEACKQLSRSGGATLSMLLLAAFQTLLYRYTAQEDIVVGMPIAGRNRIETEELIGFFINTLAIRTDLSGNPTFQELLHRVREAGLGAYMHQDLPFEKLVGELQPERSLSHTPLFQVMFVFENAPHGALELPGLQLTPLEVENGVTTYDLTLIMTDTDQGLTGALKYNADLFDASTISRLLGHLQTLLRAAVADPEQRISSLPLMTREEERELLGGWNQTEPAYPPEATIAEAFQTQAARRPGHVALVYEGRQLTYRELNRRANQLAHYLRARGVREESVVALCLERGLELVVAVLGVLKAGGAYLPLDPQTPREHLSFMLTDAGAQLVLTQRHLLDALPEGRPQRRGAVSGYGVGGGGQV